MNIFRNGLPVFFWMLTLALFSPPGLGSTLASPGGQGAVANAPAHKMQQLLEQGLQLAGPSPGRKKTVYAQALKLR